MPEEQIPQENESTTEVQVVKPVKGKTVISFKQPTPMWATWIFRCVFLLTTAAFFVIASDGTITPESKVQIFLYMKAGDFVVWGMAKGVGIKKEDFAADAPELK